MLRATVSFCFNLDCKRERERGREGGREGGRERGREGGREGGREREGEREGGREGERERGRERGRVWLLLRMCVGLHTVSCTYRTHLHSHIHSTHSVQRVCRVLYIHHIGILEC